MVRSCVHDRLRLTILVVASAVVGACGDPVLPSDYVGPPASVTTGRVVVLGTVTTREATTPRLSLEWLTSLTGAPGQSTLEGQPLRFSRSSTLTTDWDIGLEFPTSSPSLVDTADVGTGGLQISIGKMVYYDDRNRDGRLDWTCRTGACDQAKAVSVEYVVYVAGSKACRTGASGGLEASGARPTSGFSYYELNGFSARKLRADESVNFYMTERSLPENDPSEDLRRFASMLLTTWSSRGALTGACQ